MGLIRRKKTPPADDEAAVVEHFFDETFREELRNHGRWYFEKVITESGKDFKQELESTTAEISANLQTHITTQLDSAIAQINAELKSHVTEQLDAQIAEYGKTIKDSQAAVLATLQKSAEELQSQQQQLIAELQKTAAYQDTQMKATFEESKTQIAKMTETQGLALQWLSRSVQALQEQHAQLANMLQKTVVDEEARLVDAFEQNMARVIEFYLLNALGDQYDLKAQLPSIIKQMEANKKALLDDVNL